MRRGIWKDALTWSRNLRESRWTLARRLFWTAVGWVKSWRVGLSGLRQPQLGSHVLFEGERWQISNFAWQGGMVLTRSRDGVRRESVDRRQCTPIWTPREFWHRVVTIRRWWVTSWLEIWVQRRLDPAGWQRFDRKWGMKRRRFQP